MDNKNLINREISWLKFNERVLQEAQDNAVPLIQRLRFLGIFSNNLDEFFRVRMATINRLIEINKNVKKSIEEDPKIILRALKKIILEQQAVFEQTYAIIKSKLETKNIVIVNEKQITARQGVLVKEYFNEKIRPTIIPIMLGSVPIFPQLRDDSIYLAVKLSNSIKNNKKTFSLIEIPAKIHSRFYVIPQKSTRTYVMLLDDIIRYNLEKIYSNFDYEKKEAYTFKITRDADFDLDHDYSHSFLEIMKSSIQQRKKGEPVRFVYDKEMPRDLQLFLRKKLNIGFFDTKMPGIRYHNFKDFINFPDLGNGSLIYKPTKALKVPYLEFSKSIFKVIAKKDFMFYFPFQSFNYIIDFLREAAIDPKVTDIKISLYRVANNSNIINALIRAAKNGKNVVVVIELLARFDEKANINWSKVLKDEGINVIYGVPGYKVHSKMILVKRIELGKTRFYSNISTGNFNESSAKIYCDHSLLTSDTSITSDVNKVFELIETGNFNQKFDDLLVSPNFFRSMFCSLIDNEISAVENGKEAYIYIKVNNIVDKKIIEKLYFASQKGVKIKIIVRGICCLIPNKKGLSENIEAISIVDKFLEHSRFYIFNNNGDCKAYISSADLMTRNLDNRVEISTPIKDKTLKKELLFLFNNQWNDNVKARIIDENNSNKYKKRNSLTKIRHQVSYYAYLKEETMLQQIELNNSLIKK